MIWCNSSTIKRWRLYTSLCTTILFFGIGQAQAFHIPTGNNNLNISWNNTVIYDLGLRVDSRDSKILNNPLYYESDSNFGQGDIITSRFSIASVLELSYQPKLDQKYGVLVSADAWYDPAYSDTHVNVPPGYPTSTYDDNKYSSHTKRYYRGPSAELLEAFAFLSGNLGTIPVNAKVGRLVEQWGPGLLLGAQEISVNQQPMNIRKALAVPGSTVRELFLPVGQFDVQADLTNTLSVSAEYFFEYEPTRFAEGGTYFGGPDFLFKGPDRAYFPNPNVPGGFAELHNAGYDKPPSGRAEFGVMAQWQPTWLNGTLGFYYRRFNNKQPWVQLGAPTPTTYREVFPSSLSD